MFLWTSVDTRSLAQWNFLLFLHQVAHYLIPLPQIMCWNTRNVWGCNCKSWNCILICKVFCTKKETHCYSVKKVRRCSVKCEFDVCVAYKQISLFVRRTGRCPYTVIQARGSHRNSVERCRLDKTDSEQTQYSASLRMVLNFPVPRAAGVYLSSRKGIKF
jgi:hypothetical protein